MGFQRGEAQLSPLVATKGFIPRGGEIKLTSAGHYKLDSYGEPVGNPQPLGRIAML